MKPNTFDPMGQVATVTIVGVGGTGAQVARSVARMAYDMRAARLHAPNIVLIDPDIVEPQNVGRQLFTEGDVGQYKAHVLMRRFNMALGLDIKAINQPVDAKKHLKHWDHLIVGCVDNHIARREIAEASTRLWIDAGNHASAGQVIIGNTDSQDLMLKRIEGETHPKGTYRYLPNAALLFPSLLEPEPEKPQPAADVSCAELVAQREQDLLINDWMAVITSQYIYKVLHRQPIHSFITFVSADGMNVRSVPICKDELLPYLQVQEEAQAS